MPVPFAKQLMETGSEKGLLQTIIPPPAPPNAPTRQPKGNPTHTTCPPNPLFFPKEKRTKKKGIALQPKGRTGQATGLCCKQYRSNKFTPFIPVTRVSLTILAICYRSNNLRYSVNTNILFLLYPVSSLSIPRL